MSSAISYAANDSTPSMERGTYRMRRALNSRSQFQSLQFSKRRTKTDGRFYNLRPSCLSLLVALLALASMSSFAIAYYLFSSRWATRALGQRPIADLFQDVSLDTRPGDSLYDPNETFLSYLPHSGFHNQRIAFENALVLARIMNRTLLVPPIFLGSQPIHYSSFDALHDVLTLSNKVGLLHCSRISPLVPLPLECTDYAHQTQISWNWLLDLTRIQQNQRLHQRWNFSESWLYENLHLSKSDISFIKDSAPYQYRFLDTRNDASPATHKYSESIYISDLVEIPHRLIQLGSLFGSSRLRLKDPSNVLIRGDIREDMYFTNPLLLNVARSIVTSLASLGSSFLGIHLRLGDGDFRANSQTLIQTAWRQVLDTLNYTHEEFFAEKMVLPAGLDRSINSRPRQRSSYKKPLMCRYLHRKPSHLKLNTPIFISTDVDPGHSVFLEFHRTFPCVFFLYDFPADTAPLDELRSAVDGVNMKQVVLPFLDALILSHAYTFIGTANSTFSTYIQDVLWRKQHNLKIVLRG
ncbi:hypothetical protein H0H93_007916 [Arthromyces matolae]|nr:hypothetical protein H0H93_007916 [Arthromyces matolae]